MTPAEILTIVKARQEGDVRQHEAARIRNYELAQLVAIAHHDPKKLPQYRSPEHPGDADSPAHDAKARGAMIAWALQNGAKMPQPEKDS